MEKNDIFVSNQELGDTLRDVFRDYCGGEIALVNSSDVPMSVIEKFEWYSQDGLAGDECDKGNFDTFFRVEFDNYTTYIALQKNKSAAVSDLPVQSALYIYEADNESGLEIGSGEIVLSGSLDLDVPYVGYTKTNGAFPDEPNFTKKGFGRKRLFTMNAMTQMLKYGSLKSSDLMEPNAESLWENLVSDGIAEKVNDAGQYSFKSIADK